MTKIKFKIIIQTKGLDSLRSPEGLITEFMTVTENRACKLMSGLSFYQHHLPNNTFDWIVDNNNNTLRILVDKEYYQVLHAYICGFLTGSNAR